MMFVVANYGFWSLARPSGSSRGARNRSQGTRRFVIEGDRRGKISQSRGKINSKGSYEFGEKSAGVGDRGKFNTNIFSCLDRTSGFCAVPTLNVFKIQANATNLRNLLRNLSGNKVVRSVGALDIWRCHGSDILTGIFFPKNWIFVFSMLWVLPSIEPDFLPSFCDDRLKKY